MRFNYVEGLTSVSYSHFFLCLSLSLFILAPRALFLPRVMELHKVDATLALSLSLSTLNHPHSAQSVTLRPGVETRGDVGISAEEEPSLCAYSALHACACVCVHTYLYLCYPFLTLGVRRVVCGVYVRVHPSYFGPSSDASEDVSHVKMRLFFFFFWVFSVPSIRSVTKRLNCHYRFVLPPLSLVHNGNYVFIGAFLLLMLSVSLLLWYPCTVREAVQETSLSIRSLLSVSVPLLVCKCLCVWAS